MTKTYKNLYPHICAFENLYLAHRKARRGGKRKKPQVAEFEHAANIIDRDNDGKFELYVNADNLPNQEGALRRYKWNGTGFDAEEVIKTPVDHMTFNVTGGKL